MNKLHAASLLTWAAGLMTLSGILMAAIGQLASGGIFWAAASGVFFAAWHFRLAEARNKETEENNHEKTAV